MGQELALLIMSGPDDGRRLTFKREQGDGGDGPDGAWIISMGRRDDCDVCLAFDTQISRVHARLILGSEGRWMLEDSASRNGTFVGKTRIESTYPIAPGVLFRIGRTWLQIEEQEQDL